MRTAPLFYRIVMIGDEEISAPTKSHPEGQVYKNLHIEEIDKDLLALPGFENSRILSERVPYKIPVFEKDNEYQFKNAKEGDIIKGNIIQRIVKPYYLHIKGKIQVYDEKHQLAGKPVVATSVKYFVFANEDENSIFRRMTTRLKRVPEGELGIYNNYLSITPESGSMVVIKDDEVDITVETPPRTIIATPPVQ